MYRVRKRSREEPKPDQAEEPELPPVPPERVSEPLQHESSTVWKWIPGYEGLYKVSSDGRVRRAGNDLKFEVMRSGHLRAALWKRGKVKRVGVHRLVLFAFVGRPPKGYECCHRDDNPKNNKLENLYWGSRRSNRQDAFRNRKLCTGEQNPNSKLTANKVKSIRRMRSNGVSQGRLAKMFDVSKTLIGKIERREVWKDVL